MPQLILENDWHGYPAVREARRVLFVEVDVTSKVTRGAEEGGDVAFTRPVYCN